MPSLAYERLLRASSAMPEGQRPPEMTALLESLEGMQAAEAELRQATKQIRGHGPLVAGTNPRMSWPPPFHPLLFSGLVRVLRAAAAGERCGLPSLETQGSSCQDLLVESCLSPFVVCGSYSEGQHRGTQGLGLWLPDAARVPFLDPLCALKLLAGAFVLEKEMRPQALHTLDFACELLWPGSIAAERRAAERLLERRQWVPALGRGQQGQQGQQEAAPCSPLAWHLQAALQQYSPGTSLADLKQWAALLRLDIAWNKNRRENGLPSPNRAPPRQLLVDCQVALSAAHAADGIATAHAAVWALSATLCQVMESPGSGFGTEAVLKMKSPRGRQLVAFGEAALAAATSAGATLAAAELARELGVALLVQSVGDPQRAAVMTRAVQLEAQSKAWLRAAKPWVPSSHLGLLQANHSMLTVALKNHQALEAGQHDSGVPSRSKEERTLTCAGCGRVPLHLCRCSACLAQSYCSKECQVKHWKDGGHKAECGRLKAQRESTAGAAGGSSTAQQG